MAANTKIGGITIQLGADTAGLDKALKDVNKEIKDTQSELRTVDRLLKLDPSNVTLLEQKQKLLGERVDETKDKLKTLEKAQADFVNSGGDLNSKEYMALTREIIDTEQRLKEAEKAANSFSVSLSKVAGQAQEVAEKADKIAEKTKKISQIGAAGIAGAAGLAAKSVANFAEYEQLAGGVETLFKDSADALKEYANAAYQTAGLNANQYMETVTSFSASLISSLGGDTEAAVDYANKAIIDMSDNANKFGSDISSIQNAYSGFAKGNFTMLDNLKLGYGGTRSEMERLLEDASKLSGIEYDVDNFADIVSAIHEVQNSLGIAGATAAESATTIEGSLNSTKAALDNLITGFAIEGADIDKLMQDVIDNLANLKANLMPVIQTIWENIPAIGKLGIVIAGVMAVISPIAATVAHIATAVSGFMTLAQTLMPIMAAVKGAFAAANAEIFAMLAPIALVAAAVTALVLLIATKGEEIKAALQAVDDFLQGIFAVDFTNIFGNVIGGAINNFVSVFKLAWDNVKTILDGVINFIQAVFAGNWGAAWDAIKGIFTGVFTNLFNFATQKLQGIIDFINSIVGKVKEAIEQVKELAGAANDSRGNRKGNNNAKTPWDAITSPGMPMMANGGTIVGHGSAIVGEAGAELLTLANGRATVTPLNINMNNTINGYTAASGKQIARELVREINTELGRLY